MLTARDIANYGDEGIVSPVSVLTPAEAQFFRTAFAAMETRLDGRCPYLGWSHLYFDWAYKLVTHPRILDAVSCLLGDEILVHGSLALCKYPNDGAFVSWHQDGLYSRWHDSITTTAWIALTGADHENGCLRVIPGTHRQGVRAHVHSGRPGNLLRMGEEIEGGVSDQNARDVVLGVGEMALIQSYIVHGSEPNHSDRKRLGFIARYATPDLKRATDPVILARGERRPAHLNVLTGPPPAKGAFARWREHKQRRAEAEMKGRR